MAGLRRLQHLIDFDNLNNRGPTTYNYLSGRPSTHHYRHFRQPGHVHRRSSASIQLVDTLDTHNDKLKQHTPATLILTTA